MNKYQYIIRDASERSQSEFRAQIFDVLLPTALALNPNGLKISITDIARPRITVLPLRKENLALISLWSDNDKLPLEWQDSITLPDLTIHGYRIEESAPVAYAKTWNDGETSPGVVLLTLLKQNPKLSYNTFMHEWHERHTPKAMRIHPFWNYIRNVIKEKIITDSPDFEGIVEEHFRTREDCINPVRMFGGALKFIPNMIEVGLHAKHFLDLGLTENYLLSETHVLSQEL